MKLVYGLIALLGALMYWMINGEVKHTDSLIEQVAVDGTRKPLENLEAEVAFDPGVSSDGNGSLRIDAEGTVLVNLFDIWGEEQDLSYRQLVYEAKVRTEDVEGPVYLMMQTGVTVGLGSMPVSGAEHAITGTNDWTTLVAAAGNGGGVTLMDTRLQVHVDGPGTVWIDDLRLVSRQVH